MKHRVSIKNATALMAVSFVLCACGNGFSAAYQVSSQANSVGGSNSQTPDRSPTSNSAPGQTSFGTGVLSVSADTFLSSLGVNTHIQQGYSAQSYVQPLQYLGVRNIRDGDGNISSMISVHQQTGIAVNLIGEGNLSTFIADAKSLASSGALLSLEGPNEPNNFPITYNGQQGGGGGTWVPVAQFQKDLYSAVKSDPVLKSYPVFAVSEAGAEVDNVGLQFLTIPSGAGAVMPDGTKYADYANPHNYVSSTQNVYRDNQAWNCADPSLNDVWDGLYVEYGVTWKKRFSGYSNTQLQTLPRVTTETGWGSTGGIGGEPVQGKVLLNNYLAQFKRGWRYTFIYELRDNEGGTSDQGLFHSDSTPKLAATYIHNMTSVLADITPIANPGRLDYSITNEPATVHDLLIQKSNGNFELVVWDEKVSGSDIVLVNLGGNHAKVNVYDPTIGTTATQTLINVYTLPLTLSDHPVIIEVIN